MQDSGIDFRDMNEYWGNYQVALATFFHPTNAELICSSGNDALEKKLDFYSVIERLMEFFGKKTFVPYRDVDTKRFDYEQLAYIAENLVVPTCEIVICDSDIPSVADPTTTSAFVERMVKSAQRYDIPVIHMKSFPFPLRRSPETGRMDFVVHHETPLDAYYRLHGATKYAYRLRTILGR